MFTSTTSLGFDLPDIMTAVTGFLSIPVVSGLVVIGLALAFAPRIMNAAKRVMGKR